MKITLIKRVVCTAREAPSLPGREITGENDNAGKGGERATGGSVGR